MNVLKLFDRVLPGAFQFDAIVDADAPPGLEGVTDMGARTVTVADHVYEGLEADDGRSRFTTTHEIAHVVLHSVELAPKKTRLPNGGHLLFRRAEIKPYVDPEWQADVWASSLLVPAPALRVLESRHHDDLDFRVVSHVFDVSWKAAQVRLDHYRRYRNDLLGIVLPR